MSCSFLYGYAQRLYEQQDGGTRETKWKTLKPISRQRFFLNKINRPVMSTGAFRRQKLGNRRLYPLESSSNRLEIVILYDIPILTLSSITLLPGGVATVRSYII